MSAKVPLTFRIYQGDNLVREETLTQDIIKIGKLESSHLRIDDESVSRMHAVIEITGPNDIHVIDLGSSSGTHVNGQKVNKCQLQDGDELTFGGTRVVVGVAQVAQVAAPVAPAPSAAMPFAAPPQMPAGMPPMAVPAGFAAPPMPGMPMPAMPIPPGMASQMQQAAPQQRPYVPPIDPTIIRQDGSRAIEVTALLGDSVLAVHQLDNPKAGRVSVLTWVFLGIGGLIILGGLGSAVSGSPGFGGLQMVIGMIFTVLAIARIPEERKSPHFTLGESPAASMNLAHPAVTAPYFPLVQSTGVDYVLNFTSGMKGDITMGADRNELQQLVSSGQARGGAFPNSYTCNIPRDARIKLDVGDSTFLVNSVPPARRVVGNFFALLPWVVLTFIGMSFAVHALFLFLVFSIPPAAKALSLDLFNTDNKLVQILIKPPEQKQDEVPDWLKKKTADEQGGKGQKHKGEEGKMGSKKSKKKTGLYGLKGPKDNPDMHLAKRLAEDAANNAGVLGLLKSSSGSHIASIFGRDTALGSDAEDALGGLVGDSIGESYGVGGLGLVGTGRGGGGTGEGTIGLGTLGTIGKGGGGGNGAGYGRGVGHLRGRKAGAPQVVAGTAEVRGSLDKEIIRRIIRRHINEVKYCYSKELMANPDLYGRVMIQFTIAGTGQVVVSNVQSSTLKNSQVEQCIAGAVRRWMFPKPKGGGIVVVSYPFVLRAAGGE